MLTLVHDLLELQVASNIRQNHDQNLNCIARIAALEAKLAKNSFQIYSYLIQLCDGYLRTVQTNDWTYQDRKFNETINFAHHIEDSALDDFIEYAATESKDRSHMITLIRNYAVEKTMPEGF